MSEAPRLNIRLQSNGEAWDHVRVHRLSGREAISRPFRFDLSVVCDPGHGLPEEAQPGEQITAVIEVDGAPVRSIHGILGPIRDNLDPFDERAGFEITIVPRLFRLTLVETQEVYLGQSVADILRSKLAMHDFQPEESELALLDDYPAREITVQYRETDLAFLSRLAEHAGISFYFDPQAGSDKVVFTDHESGFRRLGPPEEGADPADALPGLPFCPRGEKREVFALSLASDLVPTSFIVQDYNYRTPGVDLSAVFELPSGNGGGVVEYGCHVKTPEEAERLARIRAEERGCRQRVYEGKSTRAELFAGGRAALLDHPRLEGPAPLLFVEVEHEARIPLFDDQGAASYENRFRAIPGGVAFRPERRTPKPRIHGFLTGVIQPGPSGESGGVAQLDSEGRYTVQLHFDTTQWGEQKASHPVRMAQPFAGPSYGMSFPLRRGTEVLLAFAGGDPDRPIIVGAVYNPSSPSPVVASNANRHQIKTATGALFEMSSKS